ncbi:MAG: translation elongation factor Ts, partial [Alphaproteobacteria bacterium]
MAISAGMVKELRTSTGAGMMDCKKALVETDGDMEAAVDWLRKKGLSSAAKKSARVAAEGLVGAASSGTKGSLVEINAETDFVARNETFQVYVKAATDVAMDASDADSFNAAPFPGGERNMGEELTHMIATIGENMNYRRSATLSVTDGHVSSYMHNVVAAGMGRIGVLVALQSTGDKAVLEQLGKNIAMHIAAVNPQSLSVDDLDPAIVAKEKDFLSEQARASGKPEAIIEKMLVGRVQKFYKEVVLLEQSFVMDPDNSVSQVIKNSEKDAGAPI